MTTNNHYGSLMNFHAALLAISMLSSLLCTGSLAADQKPGPRTGSKLPVVISWAGKVTEQIALADLPDITYVRSGAAPKDVVCILTCVAKNDAGELYKAVGTIQGVDLSQEKGVVVGNFPDKAERNRALAVTFLLKGINGTGTLSATLCEPASKGTTDAPRLISNTISLNVRVSP
jgi:hypothetical protein